MTGWQAHAFPLSPGGIEIVASLMLLADRRTPARVPSNTGADLRLSIPGSAVPQHSSELSDLSALRADHPGLMRLETWLRATGWKP